MDLLVFPGICIYFLIGAFFSKVTKTDENGDNLASVIWFIFWPISIIVLIIASIIFLFANVYMYVRNHFK